MSDFRVFEVKNDNTEKAGQQQQPQEQQQQALALLYCCVPAASYIGDVIDPSQSHFKGGRGIFLSSGKIWREIGFRLPSSILNVRRALFHPKFLLESSSKVNS